MYDFNYYVDRAKKWGDVIEDDKYYDDAELEDNFLCFYVYAFSWLNLPAPTRAQLELAQFMSDRTNPHRMVMAMRGLSKSLTSQIYVTWRLLNDPNEKILVMSAGSDRAKSYTQFVKKLVGLLPTTKSMMPRHNIERTSTQMFDVAGASPSDSASVYAVGAGNQLAGFRASLVVYDDVETAQSVESTVLMEKNNTYCMEAQNLLMSGKDESITLCTPHSMSSMYVDWIDRGVKPFILPAEVPEDDSSYFGGLAPYIKDMMTEGLIGLAVDERLDKEFLMSKKMRIGKSKYKLQYMLDVSDADDMRFPLKLSDFIVMDVDNDIAPLKVTHSTMPDKNLYMKHNGFKADKLYAPSFTSDEVAPYEYKILSVDPAGKGGDEIGISMIFSLNTRLFIKKITGLKGGYEDENMVEIANLCNDYNINTLVIEENWGGGMFTVMLEPHLATISPNTGIAEVNVKGQKEIRICETLEPIMNQHRIIVDKDTLDKDKDVSIIYSFTHQLSKMTKERGCIRKDDRIDSLANGVIYILEYMSTNEEFGFEQLKEQEGKNNLAHTLVMFGTSNHAPLNYGSNF